MCEKNKSKSRESPFYFTITCLRWKQSINNQIDYFSSNMVTKNRCIGIRKAHRGLFVYLRKIHLVVFMNRIACTTGYEPPPKKLILKNFQL